MMAAEFDEDLQTNNGHGGSMGREACLKALSGTPQLSIDETGEAIIVHHGDESISLGYFDEPQVTRYSRSWDRCKNALIGILLISIVLIRHAIRNRVKHSSSLHKHVSIKL